MNDVCCRSQMGKGRWESPFKPLTGLNRLRQVPSQRDRKCRVRFPADSDIINYDPRNSRGRVAATVGSNPAEGLNQPAAAFGAFLPPCSVRPTRLKGD